MQEKESIFSRYVNWRTLVNACLVIFASLVIAIIIAGSEFVNQISNLNFWLELLANVIIVVVVFNTIKPSAIISELKTLTHLEYKERYIGLTDFVKINFLQEKIEQAVKEENELKHEKALQSLLDTITYNLSVDEVKSITRAKIKQFAKDRQLSTLQRIRLKRAIRKVKNGKVKYDKITAHKILNYANLELHTNKDDELDYNKVKENLSENFKKIISYAFAFVLLQSFLWDGLSPQFWATILMQATLILKSAWSAVSYARKRVSKVNNILNNRSDFISRAIKEDLIDFRKPTVNS